MLMRYSLCMNLSPNVAYLMKSKGGVTLLRAIETDLVKVPYFGIVEDESGKLDEWGDPVYGEDIDAPMSITLGGKVWTFIGGGADRVVYRSGKLVLKFPSGGYEADEDANDVEYNVYQHLIGTPVAKYFAPAVALLYGFVNGPVLVSHYVNKTEKQIQDELWKVYCMESFLEDKLPDAVKVGDLHCENYIGHTVIDYGRFYLSEFI